MDIIESELRKHYPKWRESIINHILNATTEFGRIRLEVLYSGHCSKCKQEMGVHVWTKGAYKCPSSFVWGVITVFDM